MNLKLTRLAHSDECVLLIIDMQERLIPVIQDADEVVENTVKLIKFAKIMNIPIVVTEQQKLGETVSEIKHMLPKISPISKLSFSCFGSETFVSTLRDLNKEVLIIAGIEAHICVAQTALQATASFKPHVVEDAVSSRSILDYRSAFDRMRRSNVILTTTEMLMYELLEKAGTEAFRETLPLVK